MSCGNQYSAQLRSHGYRMTSQRLAILHTLHHAGTHLSPTQIFASAKKELPGLTEPTVYRTLEFLAENGMARPSLKGKHLVYQIAGPDHHHLICRVCGREVEVEHSLLKNIYQKLESTSGYKLTDSHITFFGLCPDCR
jgi:Fur family ferric uptake transcriptional regulator